MHEDNEDGSSAEKPEFNDKPPHASYGHAPANTVIPADFVEAPVYRDGISSHGTYLIVAHRKGAAVDAQYNCICVGNGKVKFYPDHGHFGITNEDLEGVGIDSDAYRAHCGYHRFFADREQVAQLLINVSALRGTLVLAPNMLLSAPETASGVSKPHRPLRGSKNKGSYGYPDQATPDDDDIVDPDD